MTCLIICFPFSPGALLTDTIILKHPNNSMTNMMKGVYSITLFNPCLANKTLHTD